MSEHADRLAGTLLGTALGDALGLPMEGMHAGAVARNYPDLSRFWLLGRTGYVSDDTEQSALVAESVLRARGSLDDARSAFRRALLGWFLRLPWGIGWGTLRACVRIALGLRTSGVASAGNGAAMRAAIVGVCFRDDPERRREWSDALARVTHLDARAVEGARFVAELAAWASKAGPREKREALVDVALPVVENAELGRALARARELARQGSTTEAATQELGSSGYAVHSVALALFVFIRFGDEVEGALAQAVRAGGDTDSNAAIVGAWCGALHGEQGLPSALVSRLHEGPFGPLHLRALARDLASGAAPTRAYFSAVGAFLRNLLLYPVVLVHAFRVAGTRFKN
jgi:ADP-ribosylglycohydrolase